MDAVQVQVAQCPCVSPCPLLHPREAQQELTQVMHCSTNTVTFGEVRLSTSVNSFCSSEGYLFILVLASRLNESLAKLNACVPFMQWHFTGKTPLGDYYRCFRCVKCLFTLSLKIILTHRHSLEHRYKTGY